MIGQMEIKTLSESMLQHGVDILCRSDGDLKAIYDRFGYPPYFKREPGFSTLLLIILEQQVSLASARATFDKLALRLSHKITPANFLTLDDETLKGAGFSRQKTRYGRELSTAILNGTLSLEQLSSTPDEQVRQQLTAIKGIGPWTANVYLLMALGRPDIWPAGDIALEEGIKQIKGLDKRPKKEAFVAWGEPWRPWRSVAAHLLWHYYLSVREKKG